MVHEHTNSSSRLFEPLPKVVHLYGIDIGIVERSVYEAVLARHLGSQEVRGTNIYMIHPLTYYYIYVYLIKLNPQTRGFVFRAMMLKVMLNHGQRVLKISAQREAFHWLFTAQWPVIPLQYGTP